VTGLHGSSIHDNNKISCDELDLGGITRRITALSDLCTRANSRVKTQMRLLALIEEILREQVKNGTQSCRNARELESLRHQAELLT
jgi:hypothetical protein